MFNALGGMSTNKSTSLSFRSSPLATDPNRVSDLTPYIERMYGDALVNKSIYIRFRLIAIEFITSNAKVKKKIEIYKNGLGSFGGPFGRGQGGHTLICPLMTGQGS